ncbi:MAG TPA: glycosyltransferase [Chloroflexota bacterium]|nr:glycosyltransferase [Chloroflexota bacterium]
MRHIQPEVLIGASPFGGAHARRGLAIGQALSALRPDAHVRYVSGGPDVEMFRRAGVEVEDLLLFEPYPASDGRLNRRKLRSLFIRSELQHAARIASLIRRTKPDLVLLDEMLAAVFAAKAMGAKVGFVTHAPTFPRPAWLGDLDLALATTFINKIRQRAILSSDLAFYVGAEHHLPEPNLWPWVRRHMEVVGLLTKCDRPSRTPKEALNWYGLSPQKPMVVVTVGALAIGRYLLEAAIRAWPLVQPDAQLLVVCGASIRPEQLPAPPDRVRVVGLVDDLPSYLAAANLAVVQAGLTTVGECLALGTPMICVPIKWHREQENNARYAAEAGGATVIERDRITPALLAGEIDKMLARPRAVEVLRPDPDAAPELEQGGADGAARALSRLLAPPAILRFPSLRPITAGVAVCDDPPAVSDSAAAVC